MLSEFQNVFLLRNDPNHTCIVRYKANDPLAGLK